MVTTRSMSRKRMNTCGGVPWSDLDYDVLLLVMMQLGVVDFLAFSGVCKSWRLLTLSNRNTFMASRPPMLLSIPKNKKDCYLRDFEGRKFKTIIPQLVGRKCVGLSCGYLILFGRETHDFWLVNPITRHELHFPNFPIHIGAGKRKIIRAILVFSPSINGWVFAMLQKCDDKIWFSIDGKGAWNHVSSTYPLLEIHAFKGKIYTLHHEFSWLGKHVCEMRLDPVPTLVPKFTIPDSHFLYPFFVFQFISSDENFYLMEYLSRELHKVHKLAFDQLNCEPCEKTTQDYLFFNSKLKFSAAVKSSDAWAASSLLNFVESFPHSDKPGKGRIYFANRWYFPHNCLDINLTD